MTMFCISPLPHLVVMIGYAPNTPSMLYPRVMIPASTKEKTTPLIVLKILNWIDAHMS